MTITHEGIMYYATQRIGSKWYATASLVRNRAIKQCTDLIVADCHHVYKIQRTASVCVHCNLAVGRGDINK